MTSPTNEPLYTLYIHLAKNFILHIIFQIILKMKREKSHISPCSTGPWHHWVVGTGPAAAVLAFFVQGSWGMAAAWRRWERGTALAG